MGFLWAILMPLMVVIAGMVVRYAISIASGTPIESADLAGVAIRSVPWAFTVSAIRFGSNCLLGNSALVTKIYFPKETFPIAAMLASLFDFTIACIPLALLIALAGNGVGQYALLLPLYILTLVMIILGIVFIVSAAGLFFRDVKYIVDVFLTFGIFFTPVFYSASMIGKYENIIMLNPIAPVLEALEASFVRSSAPDFLWLSYSFVFGLLLLVGGYRFFKRAEPAFAESI
jgi:ABC-type polysaccharide/polyol phosphate export permease